LLGEDEDPHGEDEPAEGSAQDVFSDATGEPAASEAAEDGGRG